MRRLQHLGESVLRTGLILPCRTSCVGAPSPKGKALGALSAITTILQYPDDVALQIPGGFGIDGGGMIPRLHQRLQQKHLAARVSGGLPEHLQKQGCGHELGAGEAGQITAGLHHLHAPVVQLLVAPVGGIEGLAALGEGGRIADDKIVPLAALALALDEIKHILADRLDQVVNTVELCVAHEHIEGTLAHIHALDGLRAVESRVDGEAAGVTAQIQHPCAPAVGTEFSFSGLSMIETVNRVLLVSA